MANRFEKYNQVDQQAAVNQPSNRFAKYDKTVEAAKPDAPGYFERLNQDILRRGKNVGESIKGTNLNPTAGTKFQTPLQTAMQVGGQGAGLITDALLVQPAISAFNYAPDSVRQYLKEGVNAVAESAPGRAVGSVAGPVVEGYKDFAKDNPVLNRDLGAAVNLAGYYTPIGNTSLATITANTPKVIGKAAAKTGNAIVGAPFAVGRGIYNVADKTTDAVAGGISNKIIKTGIPKEILKTATGVKRSNAEILFLDTLRKEGVSIDDALAQLADARGMGVTPSVAVTSNIPQMQTQAYLTSRGSSGSKVAADAVKEIREVQIPKLNTKLIETATGAHAVGAEQYGSVAAAQARDIVGKKVKMLQTRAKPFYERSVGVDKSVPVQSPQLQKALQNSVVVKSLDDWRVDPYTVTNVKNELAQLGVDPGDLQKLPYNSTVSLHAARTHLRGQADVAFRNGDSQAYKAIKSALTDIDNAVESSFPDYKTARRIYSEDAGALKTLKDSPIGKMAEAVDGDYSKIADGFMKKDPQYIKKTLSTADQKMKDAIAGAFLKRQLEEASKDGLRFSDKVFRSQGNAERLRAIVGLERFDKMKKIDGIVDQLFETQAMGKQSITAAAQSLERGVTIPTSISDALMSVRAKIAPTLLDMVNKDPIQAKRYNELLLTGEGGKLLDSISLGKATADDFKKIGGFLNKNASKITQSTVK